MKIPPCRAWLSFWILPIAAITVGLQQGCATPQCRTTVDTIPFLSQSKNDQPPYVYEASCTVQEVNEKYPGYYLEFSFDGHEAKGITAVDVVSSAGYFQIFTTNNGKLDPGYGYSPPEGLHHDFRKGNDASVNLYLAPQLLMLKPQSVLTVRIYTTQKFEPHAGKLLIEQDVDCP